MLRIGAGAGFAEDRIDPAVDLARYADLDFLVFECLAERTIALAVAARHVDPNKGYDPLLDERIGAVIRPCAENGVRIISNMGAANAPAAARRVAEIAREQGLSGLKIAAITGDDVTDRINDLEPFDSQGLPDGVPISANAYIGHRAIVEALDGGADVVLTGRVADPSLFLGAMSHAFGWEEDDWERLGRGTAIGHLMECAGQLTGGYFADPGFKDVPDLARLGFPIVEVTQDGGAVFSKLEGAGGRLSVATCIEQLLYELHDPSSYLTPDVIADFTSVRFEDVGQDLVRLSGGSGRPRPDRLKVSVGLDEGWLGEGQMSYAGPGCVARGRLALSVVEERLSMAGMDVLDARFDLIGVDAVTRSRQDAPEPHEVRARAACRVPTEQEARRVGREMAALYTNGPAGGGGATSSVKRIVGIASALIDRSAAKPQITWELS